MPLFTLLVGVWHTKKALANMEQHVKCVKGIDIPILRNKVALPPYTRLWKPSPAKPEASSTGSQAKKAKTK